MKFFLLLPDRKSKNFTKFDFKKFHPSGSLSIKLKTVGDLMITGKKLPVVSENVNMKNAIKIINNKKLGALIVVKKNGDTVGFLTDGDLKRIAQKYSDFTNLELKKVMKKNPISIEKEKLTSSKWNPANLVPPS